MKALTITVISLIVLAFLFVAYFGGFKTIKFQTSQQGGETLVYEEHIGNYTESGVVMERVYNSLLNDEKIKTHKGFGIYYDNPKMVEKSKLRSDVGCILDEVDVAKVPTLKQKYKVKKCPKGTYIYTEFPHRGMLSIIFGIMKVYPAMTEYMIKHGLSDNGPVMEIYDTPNKKIIYRREILNK